MEGINYLLELVEEGPFRSGDERQEIHILEQDKLLSKDGDLRTPTAE